MGCACVCACGVCVCVRAHACVQGKTFGKGKPSPSVKD